MFKMFLMWFVDFLRVTVGNYKNKRKSVVIEDKPNTTGKGFILFPSETNNQWYETFPKQSTRIKARKKRNSRKRK